MKKAIVVFYSYSGNTEKLAVTLKEELSAEFNTDIYRLEALDEAESFFGQALRAFLKKKAQIKEDITLDLAAYDLVCLGTPVWAFGPAPALRTYLNKCRGIKNKQVLLFASYGSGAGSTKCIRQMNDIVQKKGTTAVKSFLIQQADVTNRTKVTSAIKNALNNE